MRASRAARTAPQIAACSRPPRAASVSSGGRSGWRASPRAIASALRRRPASSEPVPRPTQSATSPPNSAAQRAAEMVELPMPISPRVRMSACGSTAAAPRFMASSVSASVMAGPAVKSAVGRSRSSAITDSSAPFTRQSWLMAAPPAAKFATICAVTSCGKGLTPCAQIPWLPAKTSACALSMRGRSVPCQAAMNSAISSSRPSEPGGLVRLSCRRAAAARASPSAEGRVSARPAIRARVSKRIISLSLEGRTRPG